MNLWLLRAFFEISMVHLEKVVLSLLDRLTLGLLRLFTRLRLIINRVADRFISKHLIIAFVWLLLIFWIKSPAKSTHLLGLFLQLFLLCPETPLFAPYLLKWLPFLINTFFPFFFFDVYDVWGFQVNVCASKGRRRRTVVFNRSHRHLLLIDFLELTHRLL